ncbi:MAG: ROK family protein [Muribaculaceae bacterium]|nr:ROK family protein [Muribaculaceae bacterium]
MNKYTDGVLALGIDIGGTNVAFGAVDAEGRILCRGKISTADYATFPEFIAALHDAVAAACEAADIPLSAIGRIGVGAPCMNWETGNIEGAVNLPWPSPLKLTDELERLFGIPAAGENDANAAALGEMYYGAGRGKDNSIMIPLGTGVGGAIICDGRLLHGKRGLAGELGHIPYRRGADARLCSCGRKGCLDAYVSARGVVETARQLLAGSDRPSTLRRLENLDARAICEEAAAGDEIARDTFRLSGEILGEACADFTAFSSPEAFIFFGGVAGAFRHFKDAMTETFNKNLLWIYNDQVEFLQSQLPATDAAILGAAAVALSAIK